MNNCKIYLICLDAYPETPELIALAKKKNLHRSELICSGAFTCTTITSMLSGCLGTEIIPGGIGYHTLYEQKFFDWRKDRCLVDRLRNKKLNMIVHNNVPWFSNVIGGKKLSDEEKNQHYRNHKSEDFDIEILPFGVIKLDSTVGVAYSSANPDLTLNTFLKWNFPDQKDKFYANEKSYIKYIQSKKFNGLFVTDLCHWHEYTYYPDGQIKSGTPITEESALKDSLKWLDNWDFNEPNSIFFVFADHSHRVNSYLDPPSYMTWVYFKDNKSGLKLNPIIGSNDFYLIAEKYFELKPLPLSKWSADPFQSFNESRIYGVEDGRANSEKKDVANAFGRCCSFKKLFMSVVKLNDSTTFAKGIYLMITTLANKNTYTVYRYDTLDKPYLETFSIQCDGPMNKRKTITKPIYELNADIIKRAKELYATL
jgi:hypothetical protein